MYYNRIYNDLLLFTMQNFQYVLVQSKIYGTLSKIIGKGF